MKKILSILVISTIIFVAILTFKIDAWILKKVGKGKPLSPPVTEVIKVLSPNGGEVFRVGETMTIKWRMKWLPNGPSDAYTHIYLVVLDKQGKEVSSYTLDNISMYSPVKKYTYS